MIVVIDGIGGEILSEAPGTLAPGGSLTTLGYSASRKVTIDLTNLIWQRASIRSFKLFAQPKAALADDWNTIISVPKSGAPSRSSSRSDSFDKKRERNI